MIYVCISHKAGIYTYIIILSLIALILVLDTIFLKKTLYSNYLMGVLILSLYMIVFSGADIFYYTIALALLLFGLTKLFYIIKDASKKKAIINTEEKNYKIPIGFYLTVSNIALIIVANFLK